MTESTLTAEFTLDIQEGLEASQKYIPSKYFYDERGDKLFQAIMDLDEYYLTNSEYEILDENKEKLKSIFSEKGEFLLTEFGAGDGLKTKVLLEHFTNAETAFKYLPVDISQHALDSLMSDLRTKYPGLEGYGIRDDYFNALRRLNGEMGRKVVLFLGSNIGNFLRDAAIEFMSNMRASISKDDMVLIGFDLKKDPEVIRKAYNDSEGVTREFNLNLLRRINRELDADFSIDDFEHTPTYDPDTGEAKSYLTSKKDQTVRLGVIDKTFEFHAGERIYTEVSKKYSLEEIDELAASAGFRVEHNFLDSRSYFVDSLWIPV